MAKGHRPPPLNLSLDYRSKNLPRISRTPSLPSKEKTPLPIPIPIPIPIPPLSSAAGNANAPPEPVTRPARITVDFLHTLLCMLLLIIVAHFLSHDTRAVSSDKAPELVLLVVVLALDVALDFRSIGLYDVTWSGWTFLLRACFVVVDFGVLVSFLAAGHVFPGEYQYWDLDGRQTDGPVLGLLSVILCWNISHLVLFRRQFGWEARRYFKGVQAASARERRRSRMARMRHAQVSRRPDEEAGLSAV